MIDELQTIAQFITETKPSESIDEMNENLFLAVGFSQRVGALMNEAEYTYAVNREKNLADLNSKQDETETTRKAKLESWSAKDKKLISDLKNLKNNLRSIQMALMMSIKTEREERQTAGRGK